MTDDSGQPESHPASPGGQLLGDQWDAGSQLAHVASSGTHHDWDVTADGAHSAWANLDH
ncbi:MAG: hypothetical protein QOJ50_1425 [Cryptosporangiaceae bacterium]|jgi:hypothetical protein|nr:hypothetical protein [Cryptosporangiaceae bacterium]